MIKGYTMCNPTLFVHVHQDKENIQGLLINDELCLSISQLITMQNMNKNSDFFLIDIQSIDLFL
jgi:hypothetical protein